MRKMNSLAMVIAVAILLAGTPEWVRADVQPDPLLLNTISISSGENHTCAVTSDSRVRCWGDNFFGQLGDGTNVDRKTPIYVSNMKGAASVSVGRFHTCALLVTGGVKCWGANSYGQLGNASNNLSRTPVNVSNLASGVTAITTGGYHTCALTTTGAMKCWGYNYDGQLGDNSTTNRSEPVSIYNSGIIAISAGYAHTCAVTSSNGARCWGNNVHGQLGDDSTDEHHTPVNVTGLLSGVTAISAGGFHTCAMVSGSIKCWGANNHGQLGNTNTSEHHAPVNVFWLVGTPATVSAGGIHTCAVATDGGARCWGWNAYGQLGDNSTTQRTSPVNVSGLGSGVSQVSTGHITSCARLAAGGVKCWGFNGDGQLGDGTLTDRDEPVDVLSPRLTFRSVATRDGWIQESGENSEVGGAIYTDGYLSVGDDANDKQYRSILDFNTSGMPDNATILRVELKIRLFSMMGTDPFTTHGQLLVDIKNGAFGEAALETTDFEAPASRTNIGHFGLMAGSADWYKIVVGSSSYPFINLTGTTQFRIYFAVGDNDDNGTDLLKYYPGGAVVNANQPQLIIDYVVP